MNKKITMYIGIFVLISSSNFVLAEDDHDHIKKSKIEQIESKQQKSELKQKAHEHRENGEKDSHDDEGHIDEKSSHDHEKDGVHGDEAEVKNVGPDKGILSYDEDAGFKISPEAFKTFSIEKIILNGSGPWSVPASSILVTGENKSIYRVRNEIYKRVDVIVSSKGKKEVVIKSDKLNAGDGLVIKGAGELRVAELDVTSGEGGHSH